MQNGLEPGTILGYCDMSAELRTYGDTVAQIRNQDSRRQVSIYQRHARSVLRICCGKAYVPARYPAELRKAPRVCDHTHTCLKIINVRGAPTKLPRDRKRSIAPGGIPFTPKREERRRRATKSPPGRSPPTPPRLQAQMHSAVHSEGLTTTREKYYRQVKA